MTSSTKAYYAAHKDDPEYRRKLNQKSKAFYAAHKDEINQRVKAYYAAHKDEINQRAKARQKAWKSLSLSEKRRLISERYGEGPSMVRKIVGGDKGGY